MERHEARVIITDFSSTSVETFLRFLYSGVVEGPLEAWWRSAHWQTNTRSKNCRSFAPRPSTKASTRGMPAKSSFLQHVSSFPRCDEWRWRRSGFWPKMLWNLVPVQALSFWRRSWSRAHLREQRRT